mgnify:CR=1 FL=1
MNNEIKEKIMKLTNDCLSKIQHDFEKDTLDNIYENYIWFLKVIRIHQDLYYNKSISLIDDITFDSLFDYYKKLEEYLEKKLWKKLSHSEKIIWKVQKWFKKSQHIIPLLSLNKCTKKDEMLNFFDTMKKENFWKDLEYIIEPKFDWLTVELVYRNWTLIEASTRWDWLEWDNIYENVLSINNPSLPRTINYQDKMKNKELRLRWEIVMLKSTFNELIQQWEKLSNTRNAASWSIKQLDTSITAKRKLTCFIYDIIYYWDIITQDTTEIKNESSNFLWSESLRLQMLKEMWFLVHDYSFLWKDYQIIQELEENKEKMLWLIKNDDCDMDWFVVKVNDTTIKDKMWYTWHHPRSAFAYKYQSEIFETKLNNIEWQVWRTWILTPVWIVEPININWVVVSRCSLHNIDMIRDKDIHINDYVYIQRSWEVIPYILWVNKEKRNNDLIKIIEDPNSCPICWDTHIDKLISNWWTTTFKCVNANCSWKLLYWLEFFVSKDVMNIDWLWISYLTTLVENNLITSLSWIYDLLDNTKRASYINFEWMWDKKLDKIQEWLEKSKNNELYRIITWLQIPNIWKNNAKILQKEIFKSLHWNVENCNSEYLISWLSNENNYNTLEWFWQIIIDWIKNYILDEKNQEYIKDLEKRWVQFTNFWKLQKSKSITSTNDTWLHFSITWSFEKSRTKIVEKLEQLWLIYHDNPSKDCQIMFIWEKAWSKKEKALKLWLKIYEWDTWLQEFIKSLSN